MLSHTFSAQPFHHDCINYIDDFGGAEASYDEAFRAFSNLEKLFNTLGLQSSPTKDCLPSTRMVFLGLTYDTVYLTAEVPQDKLHTMSELICHWLTPSPFSKSDLQSLIGKVSYICACISPSHIFMQRLLQKLCQLPHKRTRFQQSSDVLSDLRWSAKFLPVYNFVSLLHSASWPDCENFFCTDACSTGIGGFFSGHFFHSSLSIASLEMLTVTVSVKLWSEDLRSLRILVRTDNLNTAFAINTGGSRVPFIQSCLRDLWLYASLFHFEICTSHSWLH